MFICVVIHLPDGSTKQFEFKGKTALGKLVISFRFGKLRKYVSSENKCEIISDDISAVEFFRKFAPNIRSYFMTEEEWRKQNVVTA